MSHLWTLDRLVGDWVAVPLTGNEFSFGLDGSVTSCRQRVSGGLLRSESVDRETWVVVSRDCVRVNGVPLGVGIRVLRDRDEVKLGDRGWWFFSTETLARSEPFPGTDQPASCPRCKQEISRGADAVRCPACTIWHHQAEDLLCWTYAPTCALCEQPSGFTETFRWSPAEL